MSRTDGLSPSQFQEVHMNDIPTDEDLLLLNFVLYDLDIVEGNIKGELSGRRVQNHEKTVKMLRYNNHI